MSQTVLVQCPHCRAEGNLADPALFGQAISCPVCQQVFTAPFPTACEPAVGLAPLAVEPIAIVPTTVAQAAVEPVAGAGADASSAPAVSPPAAEAVQTPSAVEPLTISSPAEVPAPNELTPAVAIGEPVPGVANPVENPVATVPVAATIDSVAVMPSEQLASAVAAAGSLVAAPVISAVSTAIDPAMPGGLAPAVQVETVPPTGQVVATAETALVVPGAAAPAVGLPEMPVSPVPVAAVVPATVAAEIPASILPTVVAPAVPAEVAPGPQGPVTFPGQAAAFPTEITLPQEGVFIPPPVEHTFDGPLPAFLAPAAAPGAEETRFAESLPEPVARGSVKPPKVRSKSTQTVIISTITVILLFATVMFLMGDPSRRFGKKPKSKEPEEENPIARPLDSGPPDQSIEDVFARINAASNSGDKKNDSDDSKEKK